MSVPFIDAVGHALTIIRGHTGIAFEENPKYRPDHIPTHGATEGSAPWESKEVPMVHIANNPLGMVADTVRVQITGTVCVPDDGNTEYDPNAAMSRRQYQLRIVFVYSNYIGQHFHAARTMTFDGPHFLRFEN